MRTSLCPQSFTPNDDWPIELGRLTLLFARIEEALAGAAVELGEISSNDDPPPRSGRPEVMQLRLLDKRNLLKTVVVEMSRFYDVDSTRVPQLLDQLGGLNRFRRIIVHGFIRWSASERRPVFVDSRERHLGLALGRVERDGKGSPVVPGLLRGSLRLPERGFAGVRPVAERLLTHPEA